MAQAGKAEYAGLDHPVLVTGAAGCIGAWVVAHLTAAGEDVICTDLADDRRRPRLMMEADAVDGLAWVRGDIGDRAFVADLVRERRIGTIIHLAALQVPFCRADPVGGATVNVVGHVNIFEAARQNDLSKVVYASSVAALPGGGEGHLPSTLYGVYKAADEGIAAIYWQDWSVPSIGLRPHTVYGPGRDQGLTSAPTKAMLAAAAGTPYTIPFGGSLLFQYAGEVAEIVARCATAPVAGAPVFDLGGRQTTIAEIVAAVRRVASAAEISFEGEPLPFPSDLDDGPLRAMLGQWRTVPLDQGVARSVAAFRDLLARGLVDLRQLED